MKQRRGIWKGDRLKALQRRQSRDITVEEEEMYRKGGRGVALQERKMKSITKETEERQHRKSRQNASH
jgi:hypothetical protein